MQTEAGHSRRWLHGALIAALVVRLLYLAVFHDKITAFTFEYGYGQMALNLLAGRGLAANDHHYSQLRGDKLVDPVDWPPLDPAYNYYTVYETPGYAWFLAMVWFFMSKPTYLIPQLIQVLAASLVVYPIYGIGRRLYNHQIGLLSAWFFALWLPSAYLAQTASKDPWETILTVLVVWLTIIQWREPRVWRVALISVLFILGVFFRGNLILYFAPISLAAFFWTDRKIVLRLLIVVYLACIVALVPWYLRNKYVVGRPVLLKENFYFTVFCGMCQYDEKYFALDEDRQPNRTPDRQVRCRDYDVYAKPLVLKILKERPSWYAATVIHRLARILFFMRYDWGYLIMPEQARSFKAFREATGQGRWDYCQAHPVFFVAKSMAFLSELALFPLSILALLGRRAQWRSWLILAAYYCSFVVPYAFMTVESRYMVPHTWSLLIFAAVTVTCIFDRAQRAMRSPQDSGAHFQNHQGKSIF